MTAVAPGVPQIEPHHNGHGAKLAENAKAAVPITDRRSESDSCLGHFSPTVGLIIRLTELLAQSLYFV
jgi:hypothetical protein